MGAHGVYCSRDKWLKELGRQQSRVRVRQRESFLQPATRDITVFLLRGFSLVRKNRFVCVRVYAHPTKPQHVSTAGNASALLSSLALLPDFCLCVSFVFLLLMSVFWLLCTYLSFLPFFYSYFFLLAFTFFPSCPAMCPSFKDGGFGLFVKFFSPVPLPLGPYPLTLHLSIFDRLWTLKAKLQC